MKLFRKCWLLTHGNNGKFLEYAMFKSDDKLVSVDECHITSDAAVVYTYVHFRQYVAHEWIIEFMDSVRVKLGIIPFDIFGYDSVASTNVDGKLCDHVGFKVLLNHYQTGNPSFTSCTDGKPGVIRGLLWQSDSLARLRQIARQRSKRLCDFLGSMETELAEYKQKAGTVDLMRDQLSEYEARLIRYGERHKELCQFQFACHVLRSRISDLEPQLQAFLLAPDHEGKPLFN